MLIVAQLHRPLRKTLAEAAAFTSVWALSGSGLAVAVPLTPRYLPVYIVYLRNVLALLIRVPAVVVLLPVQRRDVNIEDVAVKQVHAFHVLHIFLRVVLSPAGAALLLGE